MKKAKLPLLLIALLLGMAGAFAQGDTFPFGSYFKKEPDWKLDTNGDTLIRVEKANPCTGYQGPSGTACLVMHLPTVSWVKKQKHELEQPVILTRKEYNELLDRLKKLESKQ